MRLVLAAALALGQAVAASHPAAPGGRADASSVAETRTLEQMHEAARREGGVVTVWHGGDEPGRRDVLKAAFEDRFPGLRLNLTVDLSKYLAGRVDAQLAAGDVRVDSVILQTLHDYPRWERQGALLPYAPLGFDRIFPGFKAPSGSAAYYGVQIGFWQAVWSTAKLPGADLGTFAAFASPDFRDRLVLTYSNNDDAVLFAFDLM